MTALPSLSSTGSHCLAPVPLLPCPCATVLATRPSMDCELNPQHCNRQSGEHLQLQLQGTGPPKTEPVKCVSSQPITYRREHLQLWARHWAKSFLGITQFFTGTNLQSLIYSHLIKGSLENECCKRLQTKYGEESRLKAPNL